jgi:hypothetical protein
MRPELPYLAAGGIAIAGGWAKEKKFPSEGPKAVLFTVILVTVVSATANTPVAPLFRALGLLVLLGAVFAAVPAFQAKEKKNG